MSDLISITYPTEQRAREVLCTLQTMQLVRFVDLEHACYVARDERGRVDLH